MFKLMGKKIIRRNFIAQFLGVDKWWLFFCHTTISGATTNTGTSTILDIAGFRRYLCRLLLYDVFDDMKHP